MPTRTSPDRIRVFIASPGDVSIERESTPEVINELNRIIGALLPSTTLRLELVRWESHAFPAMGRAQQVINDQIGPYDIFVGILWKRFGTPTGKADSGTEEEFRLAYDNWSAHGKPHILFYFNRAPSNPPRSKAELEQLSKVVAFREELESQGLIWEYGEAQQFASVLRPHLTEVVGKLLASSSDRSKRKTGKERVPARRRSTSLSPSDTRIRILDIGKDDGFYDKRENYIGRTATLFESTPRGAWFTGRVKLDAAAYKGDDLLYTFFAFKYEVLAEA